MDNRVIEVLEYASKGNRENGDSGAKKEGQLRGVKSEVMLSGLGLMPFVEKSNLRNLRIGQVMRSLVIVSVLLTMLCDGWLHHQRSGRQGYSFEGYHCSGGCSVWGWERKTQVMSAPGISPDAWVPIVLFFYFIIV
jgi:hypothetical protein